jgi:DNA-binding NarL/FixJ family response regulator
MAGTTTDSQIGTCDASILHVAGHAPNIPSYRFSCVYLTSSSRAAALVSTLVASAQIQIHSANTLDNAKARLQATQARVMLTDVTFERGSWEDAVRMAARLPFRAALVLVSPFADQRLWIDALECGAYDLILEPFHAEELSWILESAHLSATSPCSRKSVVSAGLRQECPLYAPDSVGDDELPPTQMDSSMEEISCDVRESPISDDLYCAVAWPPDRSSSAPL